MRERAFYSALKSRKTAINIRIKFYARIKETTFDLNINTWVRHVEIKEKKIVLIGSKFVEVLNYFN